MASERQGHNHSRIHLYLHLHSQATTTVELIVAGPLAHPPHEKEAKRALHGSQAYGPRALFDADNTTACVERRTPSHLQGNEANRRSVSWWHWQIK